jgi:hypothetical protein
MAEWFALGLLEVFGCGRTKVTSFGIVPIAGEPAKGLAVGSWQPMGRRGASLWVGRYGGQRAGQRVVRGSVWRSG